MTHSKKTIIFRADGNSEMGLGHIIRSSALAGYLKNDFDCLLATRCTIDTLLDEMKDIFLQTIHLPEGDYKKEAKDIVALFPDKPLLVLDGYAFDADYQQGLMQEGFDIFSIDDIHAFRFYSRAVINPYRTTGVSPVSPSGTTGVSPVSASVSSVFICGSDSSSAKCSDACG